MKLHGSPPLPLSPEAQTLQRVVDTAWAQVGRQLLSAYLSGSAVKIEIVNGSFSLSICTSEEMMLPRIG